MSLKLWETFCNSWYIENLLEWFIEYIDLMITDKNKGQPMMANR